MLGNIRYINTNTNTTTNATRTFECHPGGESHGKMLLGLASAGVLANLSVAGLIMARKSLRRWSSGLLIHGTIVDGSRAALLLPLAMSVIKCQPVTRCSIIDTAFLLLATVSSLNLLTVALSDAPLLPPPVLVPTLLQSAGFTRSHTQQHYASPLYAKGEPASYYSDYYEEDANLLAETTAMPDSPQCVLFGSFMVWFAALTINLGPTFLSGALAAQAEISPRQTGCPLVRGPARHVVLNALWAAVNLLCVVLAASHLRKLKKDLTRARIGLLAAAGAGLAGMAGIAAPGTGAPGGYSHANVGNAIPSTSNNATSHSNPNHEHPRPRPSSDIDAFLRTAQKNGRCHIRTLGTLAVVNLICWLPLYLCALIAPVGTGVWEDPAPLAYEITLMTAFSHSVIHPILLLFLHHPLRQRLQRCIFDSCCCICQCFGMEFRDGSNPPSPIHARDYDKEANIKAVVIIPSGSRTGSQAHLHSLTKDSALAVSSRSMDSLHKMKRSSSLKSERSLGGSCLAVDDIIPPPPLPPINSAFRKQVSEELDRAERVSPLPDNRW